MTNIKSVSTFLQSDGVKEKFKQVLGEKSQSFIAAVLTAVNQNDKLKNATPESIYSSALMAATLDLPINPNLGFAYLIPYENRKQNITECQFQIGAKGFKQLAQRTGLYKLITEAIVYEGQLIGENPLLGFEFDWANKKSGKVIGYVSYFRLANGFESMFYMSKESMNEHAAKYSQTFKSKTQWVKESSKWTTDFDAMSLKTVTKLNLSKNGPLSIEMQKAMISDQSVIKDNDTMEVEYIDNQTLSIDQSNQEVEDKRLSDFIEKAAKLEDLESIEQYIDVHDDNNKITLLFFNKQKELKTI